MCFFGAVQRPGLGLLCPARGQAAKVRAVSCIGVHNQLAPVLTARRTQLLKATFEHESRRARAVGAHGRRPAGRVCLRPMADPLEKLEAAVKKLATDMADVRKELHQHADTLREHTEILQEHSGILQEHSGILQEHTDILHEHSEVLDDIATSVKQIQKTQSALTNAMTTAIKQLGTDKSLEVRVRRLEDVVFSNKH